MPRRLTPDRWLFFIALALAGLGMVMVYSSSAIIATERFKDPYFFLKKQLVLGVVGLGALWLGMLVDYRRWRRVVLPLLALSGLLLVLVLLPPFGQEIHGTRRWLRIGAFSFQPTEFAKFALVLYLAQFLARRREVVGDFLFGFLPPLLVTGAMAMLVMAQPDLGNALTLLALVFCLLFVAGASLRQMTTVFILASPLIAFAVGGASYRVRRLLAFIDPWSDPRGSGFQMIQSYLAFGGGGITGRGLGESRQKLFYLPEPHTDFIFAIIGEELGFLGAVAVVALFAVLIWRGLRLGLNAPEPFGALLALGLTTMLAAQTVINLGVVVGLLPTKGLPLPFISFGGSSLVMTMLSVGVLLNLSQHGQAHV